MPTFGQNETAQRLFLSGVGALYALKADDKKVIKVLQPPEGIWSEEQFREEVDGFLLRAKTQKNLAKFSKNWAPVYEARAIREGTEGSSGGGEAVSHSGAGQEGGQPASGAYAVMDRYERSVQSLIDGRVNLLNVDLRGVVSGVIQGLLDIRKNASRPHGNLKPANILLANSADLATATVHLADPAPDGALGKDSAGKDLADLGKILFQLVNLRPFDGGTVPRTKEWNRLGPNGEDWRKLCGALLDAHGPAEERDLEKVLPQIQTWTAKPKQNKAPFVIAASVLFVLIAGGVGLYMWTRPPKLDFDQAKWEKLCLSYYSWFGDFSDQMSDENTRKKFANAPYPMELVKLFNDAGSELPKYPPKTIAKKPASAVELAVNPTDAAKTGYGPYYTSKADDLIDAVTAALTPEHWSLLGEMDKKAKDYETRGWQKPAAGIRALIESAKPAPLPVKPPEVAERAKLVKPADVYLNVEKTIKAAKTVTDIDAGWARIQDALKKLPQGDAQSVPLLQALPKFAEEFPRSKAEPGATGTLEDVTSLANSFKQIEQVVNQLVTDLSKPGQEIVYSELARDPAVQVPQGAATPESFSGLPAVARNYVKITDDPRTSVDWTKSLAEIQTSFINVIKEANASDPNLPKLVDGHTAIKAEVAAFTAIPPIEKNRAQLNTLVDASKKNLDSLKNNAGEWVAPYIIDPATYITQQRARLTGSALAKATPAVYAEWQKAHNALLTKVAAAPAELKKYTKYKEVDGKFTALEQIYTEFDKKIPATVEGLSTIGGTDWRHAIAVHVAKDYRENAIKDLMTNPALKWADDLPQVEDAAYVSYQRQRLADFEKSRVDALGLLGDYATINDRLDHLHLIPNEPAPGAKGWRDLYGTWQTSKNPLLADATVAGALKPINDRITALQAYDNVSDYKSLVAGTASPAPEIALTSWRKLGAAPITQDLPFLDDEEKAETALSAQLGRLSQAKTIDADQFNRLNAEVAQQRPIRWRRWAEILTAPAAIQTALDRADTFKITLSAQSDPAMLYNQALYALRKEFEKNLPEAQLKPIAQKFIDDVGKLPAAGNADIKDLLGRMSKSLSQSVDESSSAGAGPKLANWEQDNAKEGIHTFYFPSKANAKYTLTFVRLVVSETSVAAAPGTPPAGQKTIFLCTTEMPVGLFIDTVNAGRLPDLENTGKPSNQQHWFKFPATKADDIWADQGPRSWKIDNKRFDLNDAWLSETSAQMLGKSYYPDNGKPPPPAAADPMQLLSPWSAMYAARLLGCRLPTSDEWKAAYDRFDAQGQKDVWNLRGEGLAGKPSWRTQQDHARLMSANGMQFPDKGEFLPTNLMFAPIMDASAQPWTGDALAKLSPNRFTPGPTPYKGSTLWFRRVGTQPGAAADAMHDLVGNVAEYVFDGPSAVAVIKSKTPTIKEIDDAITAGKKNLFVVGGSSLSPPDIPFSVKQALDPGLPQSAIGFCDVGFRLAYTAPIDSIVDVLAAAFRDPQYLPGPKAAR